jgi:peptidoglycan/xylan/chitin deacetylase (PgdA/CDA1 family)
MKRDIVNGIAALLLTASIMLSGFTLTFQSTQAEASQSSGGDTVRGADKESAVPPDLAGGRESEMRTGEKVPGLLFYSGPSDRKQAALTFDDGPDAVFTPQVLDVLKANNVKATFFVIGSRARANPEVIRRIAEEGHALGNHSWSHPYLSRLTPEEVAAEIKQTDQALDSVLGYHPTIFRPPYGKAPPAVIEEVAAAGYRVVDWSVDTRDWEGASPERILGLVKKEVRPGGIILQHSAGASKEDLGNTVKALPKIIALLRSQGYSLVTVPQLLSIEDRAPPGAAEQREPLGS